LLSRRLEQKQEPAHAGLNMSPKTFSRLNDAEEEMISNEADRGTSDYLKGWSLHVLIMA